MIERETEITRPEYKIYSGASLRPLTHMHRVIQYLSPLPMLHQREISFHSLWPSPLNTQTDQHTHATTDWLTDKEKHMNVSLIPLFHIVILPQHHIMYEPRHIKKHGSIFCLIMSVSLLHQCMQCIITLISISIQLSSVCKYIPLFAYTKQGKPKESCGDINI